MNATMEQTRFCTLCGVAKSTPYCTACGADANGAPPALETLARRLNWGAFLLPGLWPFWHRRPWLAVAWWLCLAGGLADLRFGRIAAGAIAGFSIAAYLLFFGNRIALARRRFRDLGEFISVERSWALWGIGILCACLALAAAVLVDVTLAAA